MEVPERCVMVYGNGERIVVPFACADDGGLLSCEDPRGKRFGLVDERGLHAMIDIDARAGFEYRPAWKKGSQFRGLIWIEGYTADGLHSEGAVDISEGQVRSLSYMNLRFIWRDDPHATAVCTPEELAAKGDIISTTQGERNEEALRGFPRWQEYFAKEQAQRDAPQSSRQDASQTMSQDAPWIASCDAGAPDGEGGGADGIPLR